MYQFFSKPDRWLSRCGNLACAVVERQIPGAPAFMGDVRAVFMTDFHAAPDTTDADMDALIARVAALKPDLLLLGGDYADEPGPARRLFQHLRGLSAPLGCYAVVGNNDREAFPDIDELRELAGNSGFKLLINESARVRLPGGRLIVAGLDEYRHGHPDPAGLYPEESAPDIYRIMLSHYPRAVSPMPDLMLSGHTHGGQFNALGFTPYTIGFERLLKGWLASRYIAGLHEYRGRRMLVSKGIGASRIPLRIGVRPEIELLRFSVNSQTGVAQPKGSLPEGAGIAQR